MIDSNTDCSKVPLANQPCLHCRHGHLNVNRKEPRALAPGSFHSKGPSCLFPSNPLTPLATGSPSAPPSAGTHPGPCRAPTATIHLERRNIQPSTEKIWPQAVRSEDSAVASSHATNAESAGKSGYRFPPVRLPRQRSTHQTSGAECVDSRLSLPKISVCPPHTLSHVLLVVEMKDVRRPLARRIAMRRHRTAFPRVMP